MTTGETPRSRRPEPDRSRQDRAAKRSESARRYRQEHREERAEYSRRYRAEHSEEIAAYRKQWRERNLERARAANRDYMRRKAAEARAAEERRARKAAYARERYHADVEASRARARQSNARRRAADPEGYREERRRRNQGWRDRNRDEINARLRERNRLDPSRKRAAAQRYYETHAEELKEKRRDYYRQHRDEQLAKQREWRRRERRRIDAGLPVRRLHRVTAAERKANADAAAAFFDRPVTDELRERLEAELRTPADLLEAWHREVARIRAEQYARTHPETSSYVVTRKQVEDARMDAIARVINDRLRTTPRRATPDPAYQPVPPIESGGIHL